MIAKELISDYITPLKTSHTGDDALAMMGDNHVRHLPIVNEAQLLGLLSEDDIMEYDTDEAVGSYILKMSHPFVHANDHIYDIMRVMNEYRLTLVPVVDAENIYLGVVTLHDLLKYFAETASFSERGSIVVLSINKHDYTLSQIARIVESENALILNAFITSKPDSTALEVTLKINRPNILAIIATFERFGYEVEASFTEAEYIDSLQENYNALMYYLNV